MKIIVGHSNTDLDCIGSMVLARRLFPDHRPVRSQMIHPVARNVYNLFEKHLSFLPPQDLRGQQIDHIVVVDTRSRTRLREFLDMIPDYKGEVLVFDHHPADSADIPGAIIRDRPCGANTTLLGLDIMNRGVPIDPEEATLALIGIYSDTGRFAHTSVTAEDFQVASFLLSKGASLSVVDSLLKSLRDEQQVDLFHKMVNGLVHRKINGHALHICTLELEDQVPGLAAVVEKVFEAEQPEALFAVFGFAKGPRAQIVARSRKDGIPLHKLLEPFGGGGHPQAASALVKGKNGASTAETLVRYLEQTVAPAATAADIMSAEVHAIRDEWDLLAASIFLEQVNHTGGPVVDSSGRLVGFLTLRDIMKGRKVQAMRAPVTAYMVRPVHTCGPTVPVSEIEQMLYEKGVGHMPIVDDGRLLGIVTRGDLLRFLDTGRSHAREVLAGLTVEAASGTPG